MSVRGPFMFLLEGGRALCKQLRVHLHEQLQRAVGQAQDGAARGAPFAQRQKHGRWGRGGRERGLDFGRGSVQGRTHALALPDDTTACASPRLRCTPSLRCRLALASPTPLVRVWPRLPGDGLTTAVDANSIATRESISPHECALRMRPWLLLLDDVVYALPACDTSSTPFCLAADLCQWLLVLEYSDMKRSGMVAVRVCETSCIMYSFESNVRARSATCTRARDPTRRKKQTASVRSQTMESAEIAPTSSTPTLHWPMEED